MDTVDATTLKNRLGAVLARATLAPVAIERHGRVVAYLIPAEPAPSSKPASERGQARSLGRREEERLVRLAASGDLRLSRWRRAGDPRLLAGVAAMLASVEGADRTRLLALAEALHPGMSRAEPFGRWLARGPVKAARLLPQVRALAKRGAARKGQ